ncbi:hypothetical protein [Ruminococcus sp.]|uniref:hypothetical protein n=1 Tax=Ruminococcus sp. TaxID=41978 RepID=UPI00386B0291
MPMLSTRTKKFGQPFSMVVGVGKAHNTLNYRKVLIAKQLAVWWLEHNGDSLIIAIATQNRKDILFLFMNYFLFLKAVACFIKL